MARRVQRREAVRSKYVEGRTPLVPPGDAGTGPLDRCCKSVTRLLSIIGVLLLLLLIAVLLQP